MCVLGAVWPHILLPAQPCHYQLLSYLPVDMCVRKSVGRVHAHTGSTTHALLVYGVAYSCSMIRR